MQSPSRRSRLRPSEKRATSLLLHLFLIATATITIIPFLWLICATFKTPRDVSNYTFLPANLKNLTLENYTTLLRDQPFARWMINSLFLASTHTLLVVTLSTLGGFALAKYRFKARTPLMFIMLITLLVPAQVLLLPNYQLMRNWGWMNSYAAILVPSAVSVFGMFLFRQAMQTVPDELLQAARMDGCSELRLWWEVALPIVKPMIGAYTLLSFMASWNSFLWPQVILQTQEKLTLPIGLANMMTLQQNNLGILMAGTLLSILPIALLFFTLQKDFIAGLTTGSVKG